MENYQNKYDPELKNCPLCGSEKIHLYIVDFRSNRIFICGACSFQFMNPQYSDQYLIEYYSNYFSGGGSEKASKVFSFYLEIIEKYHGGTGRALDYGCGDGQFIESAARRGWDTYGYDVDCKTTNRVAEKTGVPVACGEFESINWPGKFDMISLNQVLEHVKDPKHHIASLLKLLKTNGLLFIAVPNIRSFSSTVKTWLELNKLRRKRIGAHYASDHHLLYFSPKTLQNFLKSFGLEIVYTRNGHKGLDKYSPLSRFIKKYITEYLFRNSVFIVVARKIEI